MLNFLLPPSLTLFIMGACLWTSLRLLYGARGPAPDDGVHLLIRILSRALILVSLFGLLAASANWLSIILLVIILEALLELILARRSAQRQAVWGALSSSFSGRPATIESLRFHQSRFSGVVGRRYRRLLDDLQRGSGWPQAIYANRRALPSLAPSYLGMVTAFGNPSELPELHEVYDAEYRLAWHDAIHRMIYLSTIIAMLVAVLAFSMIKIIPSYQEIFSDFGLDLPLLTLWTIAGVNALLQIAGVPLALAGALIIGGIVVLAIAYLCDWPVLQPVFDWLGLTRHRAHLLRLLALALEHEAPLPDALSRLEAGWAAYPSGLIRRRLSRASAQISAGRSWTEAFHHSGLITASDAAALRAAQETGHIPWTLRMLADRKLRLFTFRWITLQHILFTAIILLLGLLVFIFATAMFVPIVQLIQSLA